MNVAEILRKVADVVDVAGDVTGTTEVVAKEVEVVVKEPSPSNNPPTQDAESMVSPLQQEHELLKKATGVENEVDHFADEEDAFMAELELMKKNAGIGEEQISPDVSGLVGQVSINPRMNAALSNKR